ncbi:MAG TPA: MFS transporter [Vicinamibacterales bacterium]|nr:MFS transporter [Vicinamibacterales bacterium]
MGLDSSFVRRAPAWLGWSVWGTAAFFYLAGFYLRVSPAVMTTELMRSFNITASDLGNFSAVYFYTYVLMQIPTGVLVDSWGARRLLIAGSIGAAAGTIVFGSTSNYYVASGGRALVGAATAVGWVVTLKLATHWFPRERFAMISGLGLFMGNMGALVAQVPLRLVVERFGWRAVSIASGGVVLLIAALAAGLVRDDPREDGYETHAPDELRATGHLSLGTILQGFRHVFAYRNTWLIFLAQGGFVGSMIAFTGLWGPPYLRARFGVPATDAAAVCSVMIVCWAVASPLCGYLSDRLQRRKPIYLGGAIVAAIGWTTMFSVTTLPLAIFIPVAAVTSFACGAVILGFAYAKESVPVHFLGTISGATNVGNMLGPMLLQPAIGRVIDRHWAGEVANGLRVYGPDAFRSGFLLIVGWAAVTAVLIVFTRETHCRQGG